MRQHRRRWAIGIAAAIAILAVGVFAAVRLSGHGSGSPSRAVAPAATTTTTATATTTAPPPVSSSVVAATSATAPPTTQPPVTTTVLLAALRGRTVVVDPGHNGKNYLHPEINQPVNIGTQTRACDTTGTQTDDGYTEAAYNLDVALRLTNILRGAGATVVLTRADNEGWGPCINERAAVGNRAHADVGISIHADAGPPTGRGFHVIYPPSIARLTDGIAVPSKRLANDIHGAYQAATGMPFATYVGNGDGYSERSDLGGLNLSTVPKVFIETGNMRNSTDAALLKTDGFRQQAATGIANGLAAYLAGR